MKKIDLPLATSSWGAEELQAIASVIESNHYTMGEYVKAFETAFADFFGSKYAVMVNSGSSANLLAIAALCYKSENPLQPGDEVIVPSLSWPTTFYPIHQYGMTLVFVDIELATLNIDIQEVEKAITPKTKAIFAPNILGNPANLIALQALCKENNLYLIEDNCESMGAKLNGKYCGTYGILGTFSCFFSHHISTMEGGMIVTDSLELYHNLLSLRAHGWTRNLPTHSHLYEKSTNSFYDWFNFVLPGYNVRPLEISGAIGLEQLKKLPGFITQRRENAKKFLTLFSQYPYWQLQKEYGESSWFGFSFIVKQQSMFSRDALAQLFKTHGVECRPIISGNFLRQKVIQHLNYRVVGKHTNSNIVHDHGIFIGNYQDNISDKLFNLYDVFSERVAL